MAPPNYSTSTLRIEELKSEFRDFKLKSISGEKQFQFNWQKASELETELSFIQENFPTDIITGSLALNLLGLLHRQSADIDILIDDKNRYKGYILDHYDDEFSTKNRLGFLVMKYKKNFFSKTQEFNVDFFLNDYGASFIELPFKSGVLKIHNPLEIMDYKLQMVSKSVSRTSRKHNEDLTQIFEQAPWQLALRGEI